MPQPKRKTTKADAPVFNLDDYRPVGYETPDEREVEMRNGVILKVTLAHLNTRQAKAIPWGTRVSLDKVYQAAWKYVLDWDLRVKHPETGQEIALPAPGADNVHDFVEEGREWELLEMLDNETGSLVMSWLLNPGGMKLLTESGKSSKSTKPGDTSTSDEASGTT